MPETPHPVDIRVGQALRRERKAAGWSQDALAKALGISFQQLQKYECGSNRISASKLFDACRALKLPPSLLFGEAETGVEGSPDDDSASLASRIRGLSPAKRAAVFGMVNALLDRD